MSAFIYLTDQADLFRSLDPATQIGNAIGFAGDGFETENLQTSDITELWMSPAATPGDPSYYELAIDLGASPVSWDFVAWINHDFPSTGAYRVRSGATGAYELHTDAFTWREHDMYFRATTPRSDRHISLGIQISTDFQISAGRVLVGLSTVATVPPKYGWDISFKSKASDNRSAFNVKHIDVYCEYHQFNFPFIQTANAAAVTFWTFLKSLQGMKNWFFLVPDSTEYDGYVVRQMSQPTRTRDYYNKFEDVICEEESRGVRIAE